MKYLDKYLQEVRYNLYCKDKDDVIKELKSDILNKLGESYTEKDLILVLEEMGSPKRFARRYNFDDEGLTITNENFNNYIRLIKLLFAIGFIIFVVIGILEVLFYNESIITMLFTVIHQSFLFTVFSIGILTIIFYFIEKNSGKFKNNTSEENLYGKWNIKELNSKDYSTMGFVIDTVVVVFFSLIFLAFLKNQLLPQEYEFFHTEFINEFSVIIIISLVFEIARNLCKYIKGESSSLYVVFNFFDNAYLIFSSAYVLIYREMFYIPLVIKHNQPDSFLFSKVFIVCLIIAVGSVIISLYKYLKLR